MRSEGGQQHGEEPEQARVFFSLWPAPEAAKRLSAVADSFAAAAGGRATRRESIHLTLAFIGNVPVERLPELEGAAREVRGEPFALVLDRFAIWRHKRIFWAGSSIFPTVLTELSTALKAASFAAGYAVAEAPGNFVPHVTLARKVAVLDSVLPVCEPTSWFNRKFFLVRSTPTADGSLYENIAEFPLGA